MRLNFALLIIAAAAILAAQSSPEQQTPPDPVRDPWQMPDTVISALKFSSNETVAVIENGYPYFAPRVAPLVKQVYAVNNDPRAFQGRGKPPSSVSTVIGDYQDPHLANLHVDTVLMVDMLQFIPNRPSYFHSLSAGLRKGGRLVIIDRQLPAVIPATEKVSSTQISTDLLPAGFGSMTTLNFSPFQFCLVFSF